MEKGSNILFNFTGPFFLQTTLMQVEPGRRPAEFEAAGFVAQHLQPLKGNL
jgi:hypothetical protein